MTVNNNPVYQAKPILGAGLTPATLDTSTTAPTHTTVLATGAADGTRIREIALMVNATTATDTVVRFFTKSGSTYTLFDEALVKATTVATTTSTTRLTKPYEELVLPSGVTLECAVTTSVGQATISVTVEGWDYTP